MNDYAAYGLHVRSAFDLPELPEWEGDAGRPTVEFRRGDLDPVPESVGGIDGRRVTARPAQCRLTYETIGTFLVENGERVTFDPVATDIEDQLVVRRLFENEMLGVLCHQRGYLVLHASAVAVEGRAAVLVGPRGVGKSTAAAAFHAEGYALLEDDVVGIRVDGDETTVFPGVPQLRLMPDAAAALDVDPDRDAGDDRFEKVHRRLKERPEAAPLARCYLLREGNCLETAPVDSREALIELVSRTYTRGMLRDTDATAENFQQVSAVLEGTPVRELRRPDDHGRLPDLVDFVARDLRSDCGGL